jgi:hypothetical protein
VDVITISFDQKRCGTCRHWEGARQCENGRLIICIHRSEGLCGVRRRQQRGILNALKTCDAGESCENWDKWDGQQEYPPFRSS